MGKHLTYEQRVRRRVPRVNLYSGQYHYWVEKYYLGPLMSGACTRPRDAWRSAWRSLKGRKK